MTPEKLQAEFARCRPWLEAALEYAEGSFTIEDVIHAIGEGRMHFWPGKRSAAVSEVAQLPRKRYLNIVLAGGELDEIKDMIPSWKVLGRALGCERVTCAGRPGWERALGWKKSHVVLSTPIEG